MIKRDFKECSISLLGMGTMRFPVIDEDDSRIDREMTKKMVDYAYKSGINYFDTAWGYHSGNSETVLFECLKEYPRDTYYIADKFPGYDLSNMGKIKEIFPAQLAKGDIEYFDFYLLHNVCEMNIDEYLDEKNGIMDYLLERKEEGKIKHLGFSSHADIPCLKRFLEVYGEHMEFCQIQLNFLDYNFQHADEKLRILKEREIPIWVMEPLRGGRLADFSDATGYEKLKKLRADETCAGWAMKYFQSIGDEIKVVLTGAKDLEKLKDNIEMFTDDNRLNGEELEALYSVGEELSRNNTVPCTECGYCREYCSIGLDIPKLISLYNEHSFRGGGFIAPFYLKTLKDDKQPSACISCGKCEEVCTQKIKIADVMKDFSKMIKGERK